MHKDKLLYLRLIKRTILDIPKLFWGFVVYFLKKTTPKSAHQSLINLFCLTGGLSNSLMSKVISLIHRPYNDIQAKGVLGNFKKNDLANINHKLNEEGFYIFEQRLSDEMCDKLLAYAYSEPAYIRGDSIKESRKEIYRPDSPVAVRYDYEEKSLIENSEVQKLITDPSIISIAQKYLNTKPVLDVIGMWWHTAYQKEPDSSAAQFFHFDMDRIKWLKFFIYLTDVNEENGPHAFVKGSHKNRGIPSHLRLQGYARLSDEEINLAYQREKVIYHTAKRGTVIAEDTRGLHKGQHVERGDRLVLQLQFSNHLFGAYYPKCKIHHFSEVAMKTISAYPRIYSNYT